MAKWLRADLERTLLSGHASILGGGNDTVGQMITWDLGVRDIGKGEDEILGRLLNGGSRVVLELGGMHGMSHSHPTRVRSLKARGILRV
jgi:hypothetical protein